MIGCKINNISDHATYSDCHRTSLFELVLSRFAWHAHMKHRKWTVEYANIYYTKRVKLESTATDGAWYSTTALLSGRDRPRCLCVLRLSDSEPKTRRTGA